MAEVEALVVSDERVRDGDFIVKRNLRRCSVDGRPAARPSVSGSGSGAYRLVGEIGHGGMGTVYLAERDDAQYEAKVAIKFVRGALASPDVLARLRNERQFLADLTHPGIARLLDGGEAADGTPYLVMEYIAGQSIDTHCESSGGHARGTRPARSTAACRAVQHAHEAGIIHRDIKPTNVLVDANGSPKLVDFGIAKLSQPEDRVRSEDIDRPRDTRLREPRAATRGEGGRGLRRVLAGSRTVRARHGPASLRAGGAVGRRARANESVKVTRLARATSCGSLASRGPPAIADAARPGSC